MCKWIGWSRSHSHRWPEQSHHYQYPPPLPRRKRKKESLWRRQKIKRQVKHISSKYILIALLTPTQPVLDILEPFNIEQAVSEPTHQQRHILDWVLYREEEHMLCSCVVKQGVSSDCLPVLRHLDVARPPQKHVFRTTRNIRAIDRQVFKADVTASITALDRPTADQLNDQLHALLDRHAPATQCEVPRPHSARCPGHTARGAPATQCEVPRPHSARCPGHTAQGAPATQRKVPRPHSARCPGHTAQGAPATTSAWYSAVAD